MKMGLIGNGFVGNAIYENLKQRYEFFVFDLNPERKTCDSVREVCENANIIFVALPTPMRPDGSCDLSIIFSVMKEINLNYRNNVVVLKSTVVPGTCDTIRAQYPQMRIVFSPEFLTERNFIQDFKNSNRMIFGGNSNDTEACVEAVKEVFPNKIYVQTELKTAEMVKYFINTFLATKVSFANEIKQICDSANINYYRVMQLALLDDRLGQSHLRVPGPDNSLGFGGTCFPKDINALMNFAKSNSINPTVLQAAWEKNLEVRLDRDWEFMAGRAVSKKREEN